MSFDIRFIVIPLIVNDALQQSTMTQKLLLRGKLRPILTVFREDSRAASLIFDTIKEVVPDYRVSDDAWNFVIKAMPDEVQKAFAHVKASMRTEKLFEEPTFGQS